ncbi:MAG: hypothetical protein R3A78_15355 [Polyangiales bacterium]
MDWRTKLLERGLKLVQDERVMRLLQDERVMRTVMQAIEARGKLQESFEQRVERLARTLNLATSREVADLKRTIRRLERELEKQKGGPGTP